MRFANVTDRLRYARKLISEPGAWVQNPGSAENKTMCAITAVGSRLSRKEDGTPDDSHETFEQKSMAMTLLDEAMKSLHKDKYPYVDIFNDHPKTTLDDVLKLYDRAIELSEKEEA